jgi:ligand-binding sensor domain-containing protein/signal transduction histidine kinase
MISTKKVVFIIQVIAALAFQYVLAQISDAEKLPIKTYTTADGLGHNSIQRIVRDSRGFLWFCTFEGVSRFDGYSFTTYGADQGLPSQVVNDLLETREGQYWVATDSGLCRLNPNGIARRRAAGAQEAAASDTMFTVFFPGEDAKSRTVTVLLQDHLGAIWCGTANGLYRLEQRDGQVGFRFIELGMPNLYETDSTVTSLIEDSHGSLWIGSIRGLYRLLADGRAERYSTLHGLINDHIHSLLEDREGRLWVGTRLGGLYRLVSAPDPSRTVVARVYSKRDGLPTLWINQLLQASDGSLWAGSDEGLIRFVPTLDDGGYRFRAYAQTHGLTSNNVQTLAEDHDGNLWLGMSNSGAAKFARSGITAFGEADGMKEATAIFKTSTGDLFVFGGASAKHLVNRFDGERFSGVQFRLPQRCDYGSGWNQLVLEDRAGEWWVATGQGLYRFPRVSSYEQLASTPPESAYTTRDGLTSNQVLRLLEDSRGDVWVSTANRNGLSRWDRASGAFHHYAQEDGLPSLLSYYAISFCEDRAGNLWIGFSLGGGLVRYRDGRFTRFTSADGLPEGGIYNLFVDSSGRLWVPSTRGGVGRIDDPEAARPNIRTYTTTNGLSSNDIKALTEDRRGRIYLGTGRGIDRLDPATGNIRHYTANEGALLGDMNAALRDRNGALWFSFASGGLVRLVPEPDLQPIPPPILITGLRIAGDARPVSVLGQTEVTPIELDANRNELQIDFVALGFSPGEGLRYQYKLEGARSNWSDLTDQRTVNFAHLSPGAYRFLVRAQNADGVMSDTPATFSFTILRPFWQRWWFITAAIVLIGAIAYSLYRYRLTRLLEIERMRTRIASDLHDDIGSNLSQIAIWSDVAQRRMEAGGGQPANLSLDGSPTPLERIAATARETASSMSDIVWAINPRRDYLSDLISRMRRFAGEAFDCRDIGWTFDAPQVKLSLNADTRREVFLIFKEAVNNIVRHADCTQVEIILLIEGNRLALRIRDNGRGFDPHRQTEGHGLVSVRDRAVNLGGVLAIESTPEVGTTLELKMLLDESRWWR